MKSRQLRLFYDDEGGEVEADPEVDAGYPARDYQLHMVESVLDIARAASPTAGTGDGIYCCGMAATGTGKCLGRGTPILMFDGSVRPVERVRDGDRVMGPDSRPKIVSGVTSGRERLYRVTPKKGDAYIVNESHILSIAMTPAKYWFHEQIINVPVKDFISKEKHFRHRAKGWRTGVNFPAGAALPVDPYFLGLWLADGSEADLTVHTTDPEIVDYLWSYAISLGLYVKAGSEGDGCPNYRITSGRSGSRGLGRNALLTRMQRLGLIFRKHIPHPYRVASAGERLSILAGLIDGDGNLDGSGYSYSTTLGELADGAVFIARSLGFAAYKKHRVTRCQTGASCDSWRVTISGDCDRIPCKIARKKAPKRRQKKNVLRTGISVEPIGEGDYFGFEVGGDGLFLLGDFTVTHNTRVAAELADRVKGGALNGIVPGQPRTLFICPYSELTRQSAADVSASIPSLRVGIEQGDLWVDYQTDFVAGCRASMAQLSRLKRWGKDAFQLVIWDECHLSRIGNAEFERIAKAYPEALHFGLSATLDINDRETCLKTYRKLAFAYSLLDAVQDGWSVKPYQVYGFDAGLNFDPDDTISADELNERLDDVHRSRGHTSPAVTAAIKWSNEHGRKRQTIIYMPGVDSARAACDALNAIDRERGTGEAGVVWDKQNKDERRLTIKRFKSGELRYLCNYQILAAGFDYDRVKVIVNARRLTHNRKTYEQMAGRAARVLKEIRPALAAAANADERRRIIATSDKPGFLMVDVVGTSHKLAVSMADILSCPEVGRPVSKGAGPTPDGRPRDVLTEYELDKKKRENERREREERDRLDAVILRSTMTYVSADPFDLSDMTERVETGQHSKRRPHKWQVNKLIALGLSPAVADGRQMTFHRAKRIIDESVRRREAGLATFRQVNLLTRLGVLAAQSYTFEAAKAKIDAIASNGWRLDAAG